MKILIVDDNSNERKFLRLNLEHHGIKNIVEAGDGVEGLEMARLHRPDLIISDGLMPRMDGFQFLRQIKTDDALKSIPFLFYSAVYTGYRELELATALGAEAFIVKPLGPEEFWDKLNGILAQYTPGKGETPPAQLKKEEEDFLREYLTIVTVKLEEKVRELNDEIVERATATAALIESESKLRAITDTARDAIVLFDEEGRIVYWNPAATRMFGYSADEIMNQTIATIIAPRYRHSPAAGFHRTSDAGEDAVAGRTFETSALKKDGTEIPIEIALSNVILKRSAHSVGIIRDITERKKAA